MTKCLSSWLSSNQATFCSGSSSLVVSIGKITKLPCLTENLVLQGKCVTYRKGYHDCSCVIVLSKISKNSNLILLTISLD